MIMHLDGPRNKVARGTAVQVYPRGNFGGKRYPGYFSDNSLVDMFEEEQFSAEIKL